ncbi:hypothetical protein Tco_1436188 [Tanacetum coccineum]
MNPMYVPFPLITDVSIHDSPGSCSLWCVIDQPNLIRTDDEGKMPSNNDGMQSNPVDKGDDGSAATFTRKMPPEGDNKGNIALIYFMIIGIALGGKPTSIPMEPNTVQYFKVSADDPSLDNLNGSQKLKKLLPLIKLQTFSPSTL